MLEGGSFDLGLRCHKCTRSRYQLMRSRHFVREFPQTWSERQESRGVAHDLWLGAPQTSIWPKLKGRVDTRTKAATKIVFDTDKTG